MGKKISEIAALLEREALRAGQREIDGKTIDSFNSDLLIVGDGSLSEHLDVHAAAGFHYAAILRRAERIAEIKKAKFEIWWGKAYSRANEALRLKFKGRPNIRDVEQKAREMFPEKYEHLKSAMDQADENLKNIASWVAQWKQKGFSMDAMAKVLGPSGSGTEHRDKIRKGLHDE